MFSWLKYANIVKHTEELETLPCQVSDKGCTGVAWVDPPDHMKDAEANAQSRPVPAGDFLGTLAFAGIGK